MSLIDLKKPFEPADIEFRAGATTQDKKKALAFPYITSRAVMDRLDQVVGPENWKDEYRPGPDSGIICGISIRCNNEWVTKWDGAENTNFEAVKGGLSDAFKRAAVKWGIGRYLYSLPAVWVKAIPRGKRIEIDENEARAKLFGQQSQPVKAQNGNSHQKALDDFLYKLNQDFRLPESQAKDVLRNIGFTGFSPEKTEQMYQAVKKLVQSGDIIPF